MSTTPITRARYLVAGQAHSLLGDLLKTSDAPRCEAASLSSAGWAVLSMAFPAREGGNDGAAGECDRDYLDLHRTFVGSVERGERNVAILNLRAIARVLRIGLEELLAEGDEDPVEPG